MNKGIFSLVVWSVLIVLLIGCHIEMCRPSKTETFRTNVYEPYSQDKILIEDKDERGYTSVVFTLDKDTFGLDYLTPQELDSFKTEHNFK